MTGGLNKLERTGRGCCGGLLVTEHSGTELAGESTRGTRSYGFGAEKSKQGLFHHVRRKAATLVVQKVMK